LNLVFNKTTEELEFDVKKGSKKKCKNYWTNSTETSNQ